MNAEPSLQGKRLRRLVNKVDFERLLSQRSGVRSAHFAIHHVSGHPQVRQWTPKGSMPVELSTDPALQLAPVVDNLSPTLWLGCLAPKRHARRAVTRSLLKRQMRGAVERHAAALAPGLWLVRLRAPFAVAQFRSAASGALALAARGELDGLLAKLPPGRCASATP